MTASVRLLKTPFLGIAALGLCAPVSGHGPPAEARQSGVEAREAAINAALLAALMERRVRIIEADVPDADKRKALEFLDTRIAKVKAQSGS